MSGPTCGMSVVQVTQACRTAAFVATPARRQPRMARARLLEGAQRFVVYFINGQHTSRQVRSRAAQKMHARRAAVWLFVH